MDRNNMDMDLEIAEAMKEYESEKSNEYNKKAPKYKKAEKENDELNELELPEQEDVNEAVKNGLFEWDNKTFKFERTAFFDNKISFMFPYELLTLEEENKISLAYTNYQEGINCLLSYAISDGEINVVMIKENILLNFKKSKIESACPEEGIKRISGEKVGYCIIENKLPDEFIFNLMFFVRAAEGFVIVNFNGFTKRYYKLWIMMYKAIIETIEIEN